MNCLDTGCPCVWANSPKVSGSIHPKSEQIGGFCFSVLTNWRKNFVNLDVKSALFRKILTGHIYEKIHWVKIAEMITHTQRRIDTFNAWSQIFLSGKSKIIGCVWEPGNMLFGCMFGKGHNDLLILCFHKQTHIAISFFITLHKEPFAVLRLLNI